MKIVRSPDAGSKEDSKFVPMGTFSILKATDSGKRYLKSTGFGTCIGVAMYNATEKAGVLAHFMSHQGIGASLTKIAGELKALETSSKGRNWDVVVFAGGGAAKNISSTGAFAQNLDFASKGTSATSGIESRLKKLELTLTDRDAAGVEVLKDAVESCSLDVAEGVLYLSQVSFLMHKNTKAAISASNSPLEYDVK